jgi:hypothetical protein
MSILLITSSILAREPHQFQSSVGYGRDIFDALAPRAFFGPERFRQNNEFEALVFE